MANELIGAGQDTARPAPKKYQVIYADPPWAYPESGSNAKVHDRHYKCMSIQEISSLPVENIADSNCLLFLWVTFPRLFDAKNVIESWGFTYKTVAFVWVKRNKKQESLFWGLGSWTRSNSEVCLLGIRGKPRKISSSVHSVIISPIEHHSKKPDETRMRIVNLCGDISRIELFARQRVEGWDAWGNEIEEAPVLGEESPAQNTMDLPYSTQQPQGAIPPEQTAPRAADVVGKSVL